MSTVVTPIEPADDVVNEHAVRAAAGITLVIGAVGFCLAFFDQAYLPLQAAASFFFVEFLVRTRFGIRRSPVGVAAHRLTRRYPPDWVSAEPKMFAWHLGLGMAFAMTIITNSGIRGALPATLCAICLTLMWMETALGLCLGCELHRRLVQRGWKSNDPDMVCAGGVCQLPARPSDG